MLKATLLLSALILFLPGCSAFGEEKAPERLDSFSLFKQPRFECCTWSEEGTLTALYTGVYGAAPPNPGTPSVDLVIGDSAHVLTLLNVDSTIMPFSVGDQYSFDVRLEPTSVIGYPSLRVSDEAGLVFYATTSFPLSFSESLGLLPEDWSFEMEPSEWADSPAPCGLRTTPQTLVVTYGGRTVRMVQGESRSIGGYTVQAKSAVAVAYPRLEECTDVAIPELSLVLYRTPS